MPLPEPASPPLPSSRACPPRRVWTRARGALPGLALLAAAAASLGACTRSDAFAPACPQLGFVPGGADLIRFAGSGRDLTDLVLQARLTAIPATCHWADKAHTKVEAKLSVAMSFSRGPAMNGRTVDVKYFAALSEGHNILDETDNIARVNFPANADRVSLASPEMSMLFPVTPEKSAAAYMIYVGFRLTPEEFANNRGHTAP